MSNRLLFLLLLLPLLACSGKQKQRVFNFMNRNSSVCHVPCVVDDPSDFLKIRRRQSLLITDANGFVVPYQKIDSGKIVMMLDIPAAEGKKYTFQATKMQLDFPNQLFCKELKNGDVIWGNKSSAFYMHSSKIQGVGGGVGFAPGGKSEYVLSNSLGCGGIAPYYGSHLIRYGNFIKMELIDSGPVLLRMRFTFPEVEIKGHKVHEERTISAYPNVNYCKVESRFIGIDTLDVAICIPYKDENGVPVNSELEANNRFHPVTQIGKGYMCYAEEGSSYEHGTIFTAVIHGERLKCREVSVDGHMAIVSQMLSEKPFVYYLVGASSFTGMNYQRWANYIESTSFQVRNSIRPEYYDVE